MRTSNRGRWLAAAVTLAAALLTGACASAATLPPSPTAPPPTPVITPDPHLFAPAKVDDVFRLLGAAGIRITPNMATAGKNGEPVKRINATYASWPLVLTEFTSAAALRKVGRFDPKKAPGRGESPYILAGLNILVEFGPGMAGIAGPEILDATRREAMLALVAALHTLVGPLAQRSVEPVPLPVAPPVPSASAPPAASAAPSPPPRTSPRPSP